MVTRYIRGWKDIAKQLRVTVRHAHRLEETKALPVRRDAQLREVRIRKDELEDWRGKPGAGQPTAVPGSPGSPASHANGGRAVGGEPSAPTQVTTGSRGRLLLVLLGVLLALGFLAIAIFLPIGRD